MVRAWLPISLLMAAAVYNTATWAFSVTGTSRPTLTPPRSLSVESSSAVPEDAEAPLPLAAGSSDLLSLTAKGAAALLLSAVAACAYRSQARRDWRRKVRSGGRIKDGSRCTSGRDRFRKDKRPSFFIGEKPPTQPKKHYDYYCNKIYKVLRECVQGQSSPNSRGATFAGAAQVSVRQPQQPALP
mmetsp:Transcript_25626/g.59224  ORF Transcript_25626/g.59224 Transcript_25626/m.59224 type:complete len:185 (-) Transcript_25626:51-605(-)